MAKNSLGNYFVESFQELRKVVWPTQNQAIRLVGIVLVFCLFMAIVLGVVDAIFHEGYKYLLSIS